MRLALLLLFSVLAVPSAHAIFIDLRNLTGTANSASADGVRLSMFGGPFKSTATRFGIDSNSALDAADLVDGGSGSAESLLLLFQPNVYVDSVVISEFGASDAGVFSTKGGPPIALSNGTVSLGGFPASSSSHTLAWTGTNVSGGGRGFSIDGFHVRPVATFSANFDGDGDVDGDDFLIWQRGLGGTLAQATLARGNANGDSAINDLDLQMWRLQFGKPTSAMNPIPEPSGIGILLGSLWLGILAPRMRSRNVLAEPRAY